MELRFSSSYDVKTSSGASFSWLQSGENVGSSELENGEDGEDEGDVEMSLDAVGHAQEEDEEEIEEDADAETEVTDLDAEEETEELKDFWRVGHEPYLFSNNLDLIFCVL